MAFDNMFSRDLAYELLIVYEDELIPFEQNFKTYLTFYTTMIHENCCPV